MEEVDVCVIGSGVVGIAVARECVMRGVARVVVVDQMPFPASLSSAGNSGIIHTGFDAPVGSLEVRLVVCLRGL
jgi:glycerol-3-phosphate dehydrogenase